MEKVKRSMKSGGFLAYENLDAINMVTNCLKLAAGNKPTAALLFLNEQKSNSRGQKD